MVRADIESANARFVDAFKRKDAASIGAMYTEDATVLPPNSETARGRKSIEEFWKGIMGMGVRGVQLRTIQVESSDNLAYEIGSATLDFGARTDTIKYVVVWKRQADSNWKLAADIWNSNAPS